MTPVGTVEELAREPRRVAVDGRTYLVCAPDGEVHAYRNVCPHQYGPAVEGRLDAAAGTVVCPWHGYEFDLRTGEDPVYGRSLPEAPVTVEDGQVYLEV